MTRIIKWLLFLCLVAQIVDCSYNEMVAKEMMFASALAYCPSEKVLTRDCNAATMVTEALNMKPIYSFENSDPNNPIFLTILEREEKQEIIFAFSGTKGPSELIHEIENILPKKYELHDNEGAQVFGFFYDHYFNDFREEFILKLTEITSHKKYKNHKIMFVGHSLGGALTLHAVADGILSGLLKRHSVSVYTFGQPRISNMEFLGLFLDDIDEYYRLVHYKDLVSHLPPCIPNFKSGCFTDGILPIYPLHPPTEIFYDNEMTEFTICSPANGEDPTCSNNLINDSIDHHLKYFGIHVGKLHEQDEGIMEILHAANLLKSSS